MSDSPQSPSPLDAAAGAAGPAATEAFKLLSNETRLAILLALWEEFEPFEDATGVRFTDLQERVGMQDSGQFSYHLDQLEGQYIETTERGYELRDRGLRLIQTVIGGAAIEDPHVEPTPIDNACAVCGGPVHVLYEDGWVYNVCPDCEGLFDEAIAEGGVLSKFALDPAGITARSPEEMYAAAWVRGFQRLFSMIEGVCPTCSGPVDGQLQVCADHESDGLCRNCGHHPAVVATFECGVCKEWATTTIGGVARYHPAAIKFHYDHDLDLQYGFNDLQHINARLDRTETEWEYVSEDPTVIRVTMAIDDAEMYLDIAEDLTVVEVDG